MAAHHRGLGGALLPAAAANESTATVAVAATDRLDSKLITRPLLASIRIATQTTPTRNTSLVLSPAPHKHTRAATLLLL